MHTMVSNFMTWNLIETFYLWFQFLLSRVDTNDWVLSFIHRLADNTTDLH